MPTPTRKELFTTLAKFYRRPVAKISLELFFSIAAVIFFTVFAIKPTLQTIAELITEIEEKQKLDEQLQQKIVALATAQEEYQRYSSQIKLLDQAIPSQPQLIESIKVLEKLATDNKVIISSLLVSEIPEEIAVDSTQTLNRVDLYLSLKVIGDYPALKNYIQQLHQYRRAMVVEEISFVVEDLAVNQQLRANLSIRLPYFGKANVKKR
ncbi:MAG TPA: hypothetical protein PLM16_00120 [Candidatus Woesebacteria bacterium]|mgnify:CR=1 FL=1|nr:hypothetical protein [Candidatus Woesebacteria bacterium]